MSREKASAFKAVKNVLEDGVVILPLDYHNVHGKKQKTGMIAALITIDGEKRICVVEVIDNTETKRLYVHEAFIIENLLEDVAVPSPVRGNKDVTSPHPQGEIAKVLYRILNSKEEDVKDINDEESIRFRLVDDPEEIEWLESQPKVKAYRAMQVIDGQLYPPMATMVNGRLVEPRNLGEWERADERPEMAVPVIDKKTGEQKLDKNGEPMWTCKLDKGGKDATGKKATSVNARYNPYWHASLSPLNDQFKSAWIRPNLVTVEVEIPQSELESGYKAERAKDAVGEIEWKSGSVSSELAKHGNARKVILSRWDKPVRVLSNAEVAEKIAELVKDKGIEIPENVVTPAVKVELEKRGVKIGAPEKGVNKTDQIKEAIQKGLKVDNGLNDGGVLSREVDEFYEGEVLDIEHNGSGYSVEGLNENYPYKAMMLDAFREKYPQYRVEMTDDGHALTLNSWNLTNKKPTAKEQKQFDAYIERKTKSAKKVVNDTAKKLGLDVELLESTEGLQGKKAKAKGWFDTKTGKSYVAWYGRSFVEERPAQCGSGGRSCVGTRLRRNQYFDRRSYVPYG